jgi:hypothetical protein
MRHTELKKWGTCCHEAGHAVARVLNGDALLLLVSDPHAEMTREQRALYEIGDRCKGERGNTMAQCKERSCDCGKGSIRNTSNPVMSAFTLDLPCAGCREFLIRELACIFAGGVATLLLMPEVHTDADVELDIAAADRMVEGFEVPEPEAIVKEAMLQAQDWIERESRAVCALTSVLVNAFVLDGKEAERIINENRS